MSDEVKITGIVTAGILLLAGLPASCTMQQQSKMAEAIKSGADPIEVGCAYADAPSHLCTLVISERQ